MVFEYSRGVWGSRSQERGSPGYARPLLLHDPHPRAKPILP